MHVVIIPGLAEGKVHFRGLQKLLIKEGFSVEIISPWQVNSLQIKPGRIFVGHSLGANLLLHNKLTPALLVGTTDKSKLKRGFVRSLVASDLHAVVNRKILIHLKNRLHNALELIIHFKSFFRLARQYKNVDFLGSTPDSSVIIVQNKNDHIVQTAKHAITKSGPHEDLVLHPEKYIGYIKGLANLPQLHKNKMKDKTI